MKTDATVQSGGMKRFQPGLDFHCIATKTYTGETLLLFADDVKRCFVCVAFRESLIWIGVSDILLFWTLWIALFIVRTES